MMSKPQKSDAAPEAQLASFLARFTPEIAAEAEAMLVRLRRRLPHALELVYDNYNALAIGFAPGERSSQGILSIAIYPKWISLFFLQAKGLPDPSGILKGGGSVAKHIVLSDASALDEPAIQALIEEALVRAKVPLDPKTQHRIIIKAVCETQRPRRPPEVAAKPAARKSFAKKKSG